MVGMLFSVFDPVNFYGFELAHMALALVSLGLLYLKVFTASSSVSNLQKKGWGILFMTFWPSMNNVRLFNGFLFSANLMLILTLNVYGATPLAFSYTSMVHMSLGLSVATWIATNQITLLSSPQNFMAHLVPVGTPLPLVTLMVLIEVISAYIRPLTLSVRLMANMTAGHLLMTLMGYVLVKTGLFFSKSTVNTVVLLTSMELMVCAIQAYVMAMLLSLYALESKYGCLESGLSLKKYASFLVSLPSPSWGSLLGSLLSCPTKHYPWPLGKVLWPQVC